MKILITGGCGFVGRNLAIMLKKKYINDKIICMDNLKRRGSELNVKYLIENDIQFVHGDVRCKEDFENIEFDLMIECSAEPSVMAGINSSPSYVLNTNLVGTMNCLESVKKNKAKLIFLSTSRVYPMASINNMPYNETDTRFINVSCNGINEDFNTTGIKSMYGMTKLASEMLIQEYTAAYRTEAVINRCGVIAGPWQMGKIDQGVMTLWVLHHMLKLPLKYIGYDGKGKQVRDFVHIDDLFNLVNKQMCNFDLFKGETYCIGGGQHNSFSLCELTKICEQVTGNKIKIDSIKKTRKNDIKWYVTDYSKVALLDWYPKKNLNETIINIHDWLKKYKKELKGILW